MSIYIRSGAKTKNHGVAGWKAGQTWHRNNCSHAKKYNKKNRDIACKAIFSLLIWDRQLKFMLQHPTVWFDRKQLKYLSKELLLFDFLHKRSTDVWRLWQTALADDCINKPLKNLSWSYWRLIIKLTSKLRTTELWDALKSFILTSLKFKVAPYPIIVSLDR